MTTTRDKKIVIQKDGPYLVHGDILLVRKEQIVSEYCEPLTWRKSGTIETREYYELCRCGHSKEKPFCDCSHFDAGFDGTETADTDPTVQRQEQLVGGVGIVIKRDDSLCMDSGFCGNRLSNIDKLIPQTGDIQIRAQVMAMIERCPSGSLLYSIDAGGENIEPDLPEEIAVTTEITSTGPIEGSLWVTGNIPVERADGLPFETRNRVTLCSCGESANKPLCDGAHRKRGGK